MKINPKTKQLFTDTGELIKVLHCPLQKKWEQLAANLAGPHRHCAGCEREVLNTDGMSDAEVLATVHADPSTCLFVSGNQQNLAIISNR